MQSAGMFIRRQDVLDRFSANFRETEDGQVLFQPGRATTGLPITWGEYEAVLAVFEQRHMVDMVLSWVAILGGGGFGLYKLLAEDSFSSFFAAFGTGLFLAFMISFRGHLNVLLPLIKRRDELLKRLGRS